MSETISESGGDVLNERCSPDQNCSTVGKSVADAIVPEFGGGSEPRHSHSSSHGCSERDCPRVLYCRGLCLRHYRQRRAAGTLPPAKHGGATAIFPFAVLDELLTRRGLRPGEAAAILGIKPTHYYHCRERKVRLLADTADRYAIAAGYHPLEVWPDLWVEHGLAS